MKAFQPRIGRRICLSLALLITAACVLLYLRKDQAVIATFGDKDIRDHHNYQLLNPFRNRAPESAALEFLNGLRDHCDRVLSEIHETSERARDTCERERNYPLQSWQLQARQDDGNSVSLLRYQVKRTAEGATGGVSQGPFWVWLRERDGKWRVTGYETWY